MKRFASVGHFISYFLPVNMEKGGERERERIGKKGREQERNLEAMITIEHLFRYTFGFL